MNSTNSDLAQQNAQKSLALASALFPQEEWIVKEPRIWVGKSRMRNTPKERAKLAWEIEQIRVFIRLFSNISVGSARAKIAGELKGRTDEGRFICYFEASVELHSWTYDELREMIRTNT